MVKIRSLTAAQRNRVYVQIVTRFTDMGKEYKFSDETAARKWLKNAGWKYMASRLVYNHGERQMFYAKSSRAYDDGNYAQASVPINRACEGND